MFSANGCIVPAKIVFFSETAKFPHGQMRESARPASPRRLARQKQAQSFGIVRTLFGYPRPWVYRPTRVGISNHKGGDIEPQPWVSKQSMQEAGAMPVKETGIGTGNNKRGVCPSHSLPINRCSAMYSYLVPGLP